MGFMERGIDSAKKFWMLIITTILFGIAWMIGSKKLIDWIMERRKE